MKVIELFQQYIPPAGRATLTGLVNLTNNLATTIVIPPGVGP